MAGRNTRIEVEVNRPLLDCAYAGCQSHAMVSLKKPTGWANLCEYHYVNDNAAEAKDFCAEHGLKTVEDKIAFCRSMFKRPKDPRAWMKRPKSNMAAEWAAKLQGRAMREPGEDDELREAA